MNDNEKIPAEIREAIDNMSPDSEQRKRMWNHIEAKMDAGADHGEAHQKVQRVKHKPIMMKRLAAVAAAFILVITGGFMHYGIIGGEDVPAAAGYVYAAENRVTDITPAEVLVFTGDPAYSQETEVYAPAIYYLDSSRLVFGNSYGLIIYNRDDSRVEGLIDLQAICSSYYNCDTVKTHVTVNDNKLTIYNTKGNYSDYGMSDEDLGRAWGYYHIYDLGDLPNGPAFVECSESGKFETVDCDMYQNGSEFEKAHYIDAWDNLEYLQTSEMDDAIGYNGGSYSEQAYIYTDIEGTENNCVLVCMSSEDNSYTLAEENAGTGKPALEKIETGITEELRSEVRSLCALPAYKYSDDDPVMKVICEDMADSDDGTEDAVLIPEPNIYGTAKDGDELLVFGDFFSDSYVKRGNTLVCVSGGSCPGCYHLKESGDGGYVISQIETAEDGEGYGQSIKEFTKGHPAIFAKFMASSGFDESVRKDCIKAYAESSGVDIEYYKDYGWDPIKL